jgi:general secretion pathway protein M
MQLLPKAENGRFLALVLALITLALAYLFGVHWWFTERHVDIAAEMSDLREQYARFKAKADQKPLIERQLADVRAYEAGNPAFLPEGDFDAAAAGLTQRLKQIVGSHVSDPQRCQIIMNQYSRSTEPDPFERVVIKVRLRCDLEPFAGILYDLESASPMLFVDELAIFRQQGYLVPGQNKLSNYLDIRFDLFGFIRKPGPAKNSSERKP